MKETFTLLATVILITSAAFAQRNNNHEWDDNYGNNNNNPNDIAIDRNHDRGGGYDDRGNQDYYFSEREKNMQISEINRDYNRKIQSVRNKFFMGRYQKERIITSLQFQREDDIRSVIARFNHRENHYGQRDDRYHDHDKRNW